MLKDSSLLDVKLKESLELFCVSGSFQCIGLQTARLQHIIEGIALMVTQAGDVLAGNPAAHGAAAESGNRKAARLLTHEDDDFERMKGAKAVVLHTAHRLDGADDAQRTVVVAAVWHAVAVRAEHDGGKTVVAPFKMPDDVAECILMQGESRLFHLLHEIGASLPITVRKSQAIDAASRRSDGSERCKIRCEALRFDHVRLAACSRRRSCW